MSMSSGSIPFVQGDITLSEPGRLTITHGFGTKNVAILVYPTSTVRPTVGYQAMTMAYLYLPDLLPTSTVFDYTAYNSTRFPEAVEKNLSSDGGYKAVTGLSSPWTSQSAWNAGTFDTTIEQYDITNDSVSPIRSFAPAS